MQKFKISPITLIKAFADLQLEMKTADGKVIYMPDYVTLEGKLLEDGTVEKCNGSCCEKYKCYYTCPCHNKKEEEV